MNSNDKKSIWHQHLHVISKDLSGRSITLFVPKKRFYKCDCCNKEFEDPYIFRFY